MKWLAATALLSAAVVCTCVNTYAASASLVNRLYDVEAFRRVIAICNILYPSTSEASSAEKISRADSILRGRLLTDGGNLSSRSFAWYAPEFALSKDALRKAASLFSLQSNRRPGAEGARFAKLLKRIGISLPTTSSRLSADYIVADSAQLSVGWMRPFYIARDNEISFVGAHHKSTPKYLRSTQTLDVRKSSEGVNIRVQLKSHLSLFIFEPKDAGQLAAEVPVIAGKTYRRKERRADSIHAELLLPAFKVAYQGNLGRTPFDKPPAEFAMPVTNAVLPPTGIVQDSEIDLNERGITTKSLTVAFSSKIALIRKTARIAIDHPFAFAIVDDVNEDILYFGIIADI